MQLHYRNGRFSLLRGKEIGGRKKLLLYPAVCSAVCSSHHHFISRNCNIHGQREMPFLLSCMINIKILELSALLPLCTPFYALNVGFFSLSFTLFKAWFGVLV